MRAVVRMSVGPGMTTCSDLPRGRHLR